MSYLGYVRAHVPDLKRAPGGRNEYHIPCPTCGDPDDCSIDVQTGNWHCFRAGCKAGGGIKALKKAWEPGKYEVEESSPTYSKRKSSPPKKAEPLQQSDWQKWQHSLQEDEAAGPAREYLASRGFGQDVIATARLGWVPAPSRIKPGEPGYHGLVTIPAFEGQDDDEPALVKMRWVPPEPMTKNGKKQERYRRVKGGKTILYAPMGIREGLPTLMLGGEFDALAVLEALGAAAQDFNVVAPTGGEGEWSDEYTDQLAKQDDIILLYDSDTAGRTAAAKISQRLGHYRCRVGDWGEDKDANDALKSGRLDDVFSLQLYLQKSVSPAVDKVVTLEAIIPEVEGAYFDSDSRLMGVSTGLRKLDEKAGGLRESEAYLITGESGSGKTTFTTQLALHRHSQGDRVLFLPLEMGARQQGVRIAWQKLGFNPQALGEEKGRARINDVFREMGRTGFYMLKHRGSTDPERLTDTILHMVTRYGVRLVVLDHIDYAVEIGPEQYQLQSKLCLNLQTAVVDHPFTLLAVKHPKKANDQGWGKTGDNRVVQMHDLKGSVDVFQGFANCWSVWRERRPDRSTELDDSGYSNAGLMILKNRSMWGTEAPVDLKFDPQAKRFLAI